MTIEKRYTAITLANEVHFLALQQQRAMWIGKESIQITRLVCKKRKEVENIGTIDLEPYETCDETIHRNYNTNFNFLNPEHGFMNLRKYSQKWYERQIDYIPIEYLQIQLDIYPKNKDIYRLDFYRKKIPDNSETLRQRKLLLEHYLRNNDLYRDTDPRQLSKPHCLELNRITKAPKTASNAYWKNAEDVTEKYLKVYGNQTGDFFPILQNLVGEVIQWAYKQYNEDSVGWQLDGLVAPMSYTS